MDFIKYTYKGCIARLILAIILSVTSISYAASQPKFVLTPTTSTTLQIPSFGITIIEYLVTNATKVPRMLTWVPSPGISQSTDIGQCSNPFYLAPNSSCELALLVDRAEFLPTHLGSTLPKICKTKSANDNNPDVFLCSQASLEDSIHIQDFDETSVGADFPYGSAPQGNVCVTSDYYATPETMLGSWAMIDAVTMDASSGVLPSFLNPITWFMPLAPQH